MIDPLGLGALALVCVEWLALGWLSGVSFPSSAPSAVNWALRLLVGASILMLAQLLLALLGIGFGTIPPVLVAAGAIAALARLAKPDGWARSIGRAGGTSFHWLLLAAILLAATARAFL